MSLMELKLSDLKKFQKEIEEINKLIEELKD